MIVRTLDDGSLILINQTDHARLSGMFAAHWGNARFKAPMNRGSSIRAATLHDHGWLRYETEPAYDPITKTTPSFFQAKADEKQFGAYGWAIDWLTDIDPYAGLLISRHRTGLYRGRYGAVTEPVSVSRLRNEPLLDEFVDRYEARQVSALKEFSLPQFLVDYQLLQFWDLFSLALCLREPRPETFAFVPTDYDGDGKSGQKVAMTPLPGSEIGLDPFPFDERGLEMGYAYRHLPTANYPDEEAFRRAYFGAAPRLMQFRFV
jgi:hypothetical protein